MHGAGVHVSEGHQFAVHTFTAVITTQVDCVTIKHSLFGDSGRSDAIRNFGLYRVLFAEASAAYKDRDADADT